MVGIVIIIFILVLSVAMIDGKLKKKLENDERIIDRLDLMIKEIKELKKESRW